MSGIVSTDELIGLEFYECLRCKKKITAAKWFLGNGKGWPECCGRKMSKATIGGGNPVVSEAHKVAHAVFMRSEMDKLMKRGNRAFWAILSDLGFDIEHMETINKETHNDGQIEYWQVVEE